MSARKSNILDILDILDIQNYIKLVEKNKCIVLNNNNYATYVQSLTFIYLAEDAVEYLDVRIIVNYHCVQQLCAIVCRFLC